MVGPWRLETQTSVVSTNPIYRRGPRRIRMVQVCRSGLADALQRTDWRIVGWRGSGTWKPSRFVEVVTINRHIKILAWMHVAMGGGLFLVALALLASVYFEGPEYIHTLPFLFGLFTWLAAGLFIPSLAGGIGLLRKKTWARILIIFVSLGFLFAFPIGTALGAYGLWALLKRETGPAFASWPALTARIDQPRRGLPLAMLSVAAAFVLVIGGGFLLARSSARTAMNGTFGVVTG